MKRLLLTAAIMSASLLNTTVPLRAAEPAENSNPLIDRLLDRIVNREAAFMENIGKHKPLIETYIQEIGAAGIAEPNPNVPGTGDMQPLKDHYFLGRFQLSDSIRYEPLIERTDAPVEKTSSRRLFHLPFPINGGSKNTGLKNAGLAFLPRGFAQMTVIDLREFNRQTYHFEYVRREFLGDVRCLVFDVAPVDRSQAGKFIGRIWVEDRDDSIVRLNGTYVPAPTQKGTNPEVYFHFDSWRVNTGASTWVPSQIYIEEEGSTAADGTGWLPRFKAQSRIWDYAAAPANKLEELTSILVESESPVKDQDTKDVSPLESQRGWEKQAEDNLLARLEKGGLLAPPGPVDRVLDTVVNNLIVSANLNIEAHCRVLLTSPIETFTIGHTIVIGRGLIDVLPDETGLALMLAGELSHIALGHPTQTQFAFNNQTMLSDAELLQRFRFARTPEEMAAAAKKTIDIMKASPYHNTANAGLFLKALAVRGPALPMLLKANLGDQIADPEALSRLAEFAASAPPLEEDKLEQIAALPLGSRVKLNPWNNQIELIKTRPVSLLSAREKMPFEVTPFVLNLSRVELLSKEPAVAKSATTEAH